VGHRAGLDYLEKRKSLAPAGIRTPDRPARSLVTISTAQVLVPFVVSQGLI
jgi:hypothetical protein